ncbi:endonuclease [Luteimonas aestuarii]|uniref:endonuclease n=1 Tax=Luteimonas aestuarii TaxID=453837 RepID=UPI0014044C40|nr:endonuclease [Luteimonas aestuarii]
MKNADRFLADVYEAHPFEVFCGCEVDVRTKVIDLDRCGFEPQNPSSATNTRMQWEHVFPKSWVAAAMGCGTRTECLRDQQYVDAETDLYNLVPGIGSLNATRGDRWLWEIPGEERRYGRCDFERATVAGETVIEPPDAHKGNVARIILYYIEQYGLDIDDQAIALYLEWHAADPVDADEFQRAEMIRSIVGHANPWVTGDR